MNKYALYIFPEIKSIKITLKYKYSTETFNWQEILEHIAML